MFQRKLDPHNSDEEKRPVFGFFANMTIRNMNMDIPTFDDPYLYRIQVSDLAANTLVITERIEIKSGDKLTNRI